MAVKPYRTALRQLVDTLFPPACALCGATLDRLEAPVATCRNCLDALPWHADAHRALCQVCGLLAGADCACRKHRAETGLPWSWDRAYSGFWFAGPIALAIGHAKFQARAEAIARLGEWTALAFIQTLAARDPAAWPDLLVPVPLHPRRLFGRGYNQALELVRPLARQSGIRLEPGAATRIVHTPGQAQTGATRNARFAAVEAAFVADRHRVAGKRVALFDDVHTTGATFESLARTMRGAGATAIEVWSAARVK